MSAQAMLKMAVEAYAEISGMSVSDVAKACLDIESQTAKNVIFLIEAAQ